MKFLEVAIASMALLAATGCDAGSSSSAAPVSGEPVRAGSETPLDRLIDLELVGGNLAFFESISGPAKQVGDWQPGEEYRNYEVSGCDIQLITQGQKISAITVFVTPQCNPDGFGMRYHGATLADAEAQLGGGRYVGGCISMCGNAADPTYGYEIPGYRANGNLSYRIEAAATTEADWDRLSGWAGQMRASRGDDYVASMTYQCDGEQDQAARSATKDLKVVSVTVAVDAPNSLTCS